jgi:hypothetical protein
MFLANNIEAHHPRSSYEFLEALMVDDSGLDMYSFSESYSYIQLGIGAAFASPYDSPSRGLAGNWSGKVSDGMESYPHAYALRCVPTPMVRSLL